MLKYKWGLYKTVEFLESRVNGVEISNHLIRQLRAYESRISERLLQPLSTTWDVTPGMPIDEVTIRNTYVNSFLKGENYNKTGKEWKSNNHGKQRISWKEGDVLVRSVTQTKRGPLKGILKGASSASENRANSLKRVEVEIRKSLTSFRNQSERKSAERE